MVVAKRTGRGWVLAGLVAVVALLAAGGGYVAWKMQNGPSDAERYLIKTWGLSTASCVDSKAGTFDCSFSIEDARGQTCTGRAQVEDDGNQFPWIGLVNPVEKCGAD